MLLVQVAALQVLEGTATMLEYLEFADPSFPKLGSAMFLWNSEAHTFSGIFQNT